MRSGMNQCYTCELVDSDRAERVLIDHVVDLQEYRGEDVLLYLNLAGGIGATREHVVMGTIFLARRRSRWSGSRRGRHSTDRRVHLYHTVWERGNVGLDIWGRMSGRTHWEGGRQVGVFKIVGS